MLNKIKVTSDDKSVIIIFIFEREESMIKIPKELAYKLADDLYKELYDEPSYSELEDKVYKLEALVEALEETVDYYRELDERYDYYHRLK
ncbi:hypothetical protein SAMN04244560_02656 [Thermoanaerobacter thermohydrosulfuricus]|uniref:Uncharacterized protein n=1 Tax=Thermoanaerobacter thermohydrosulfuricus TaxID=1516 RepID=A0A1G7VR81_THETY|nr:hypothetical protein [Thermoanaerobacter thermohydrosulfuricus]SDG62101.1 hypothetical protein SAMN04244560_02656 [Thermoanaerobacter thermohydrosulfuricus]